MVVIQPMHLGSNYSILFRIYGMGFFLGTVGASDAKDAVQYWANNCVVQNTFPLHWKDLRAEKMLLS